MAYRGVRAARFGLTSCIAFIASSPERPSRYSLPYSFCRSCSKLNPISSTTPFFDWTQGALLFSNNIVTVGIDRGLGLERIGAARFSVRGF